MTILQLLDKVGKRIWRIRPGRGTPAMLEIGLIMRIRKATLVSFLIMLQITRQRVHRCAWHPVRSRNWDLSYNDIA